MRHAWFVAISSVCLTLPASEIECADIPLAAWDVPADAARAENLQPPFEPLPSLTESLQFIKDLPGFEKLFEPLVPEDLYCWESDSGEFLAQDSDEILTEHGDFNGLIAINVEGYRIMNREILWENGLYVIDFPRQPVPICKSTGYITVRQQTVYRELPRHVARQILKSRLIDGTEDRFCHSIVQTLPSFCDVATSDCRQRKFRSFDEFQERIDSQEPTLTAVLNDLESRYRPDPGYFWYEFTKRYLLWPLGIIGHLRNPGRFTGEDDAPRWIVESTEPIKELKAVVELHQFAGIQESISNSCHNTTDACGASDSDTTPVLTILPPTIVQLKLSEKWTRSLSVQWSQPRRKSNIEAFCVVPLERDLPVGFRSRSSNRFRYFFEDQ